MYKYVLYIKYKVFVPFSSSFLDGACNKSYCDTQRVHRR
jgi:hypothetical protein